MRQNSWQGAMHRTASHRIAQHSRAQQSTHTDHMYTRTVFEVVLIKAPAKGIKVTIIFSLTNINGLDMCFVLFSLDRRYCSLSLRGYILVILIEKEK